MTETLKFDLLLTGGVHDDVVAFKKVEITCVYGRPAVAPRSLDEIPFTIKEVAIEGRIPDYQVKEFIIDALGGMDKLKDSVLMNVKGGVA